MITRLVIICLLGCFSVAMTDTAQARTPSLFYTQEERTRIDEEVLKNPPDAAARAKHLLHLGTILYYGPDNWSLWIQGEKWTPATEKPDVKILAVTPDEVHLTAKLQSGRVIDHVLLRPHQSLNLLTGHVIEGL